MDMGVLVPWIVQRPVMNGSQRGFARALNSCTTQRAAGVVVRVPWDASSEGAESTALHA